MILLSFNTHSAHSIHTHNKNRHKDGGNKKKVHETITIMARVPEAVEYISY